MKKENVTTVSIIAFAILLFGLACNLTQKENISVDKGVTDNTKSETSETAENIPNEASVPKDISGKYEISGTNENGGNNYKGTLDVTKRDEVYQFSWDTGGKKSDGVGVQNETTVAAAFTEGTNGEGCGVVLYKINADGSLDGIAGYWGINQSETEKAVRTSGNDLEGEYDVEGTNPEGKNYNGKLSVKTEGAGYTFSWTGTDTMQGFGIRQGDKVAVGLGGKQCGFVSYTVESDGILNGKWGGYGSTSVGTETANKKQ